jgi:putative ABC transport system permease protein
MTMVGTGAAVAGLLLGAVTAAAAAAVLRQDGELAAYLPSRVPLPSPGVLAVLLAITISVTVLGSWLPSRRAASLAPSDAIREWS